MDNTLFHGSTVSGLDVIKPRESTHGKYVYATNSYVCSLIFSAPIGNDLIYSLGRENENEPYSLVELTPHSFDKLLNASSTIYTVPASSFKDIKTGFTEFVSEEEVPVLSSRTIRNIGKELEKEEKLGNIKIYRYPNKPLNFIDYHKKHYMVNIPNVYLLYHPEELDNINELNNTNITFEDLLLNYKEYLIKPTNNEKLSEVFLVNLIHAFPNKRKEILDTYNETRILATNEKIIITGDSLSKEEATKLLEELTQEQEKIDKLFKYNRQNKIVINIFNNPSDYRLYTSIFTKISDNSYSSCFNEFNMINLSMINNLSRLKERIVYYITHMACDKTQLIKDDYLKNAVSKYMSDGFNEIKDSISMRNWFADAILRRDRNNPSTISPIKKYGNEFAINNGKNIGILILKYLLEKNSIKEVLTKISEIDDTIIINAINYYKNKYAINTNLFNSKKLQDVMDWMNINILYGYLDREDGIHIDTLDGFYDNGMIINNDKFIENKVGTCIDQGKFIGYIFYQFGLDTHFYYIHPKEEYMEHSHLTVIAYDYLINKWINFEHSNSLNRGIKTYNSIDEALQDIVGKRDVEVVELPTIPDDIEFKEFINYVKDQETKRTITY